MSRLDILKNSLSKKEKELQRRLDDHFSDVKSVNGQPLNDKRNGRSTMSRWDTQMRSIKNLEESIEKTKRAIAREEDRDENIANTKQNLPSIFLELIESGEIIQWRKYPTRFFVKGVEKARIIYKNKKYWGTMYTEHLSPENLEIFMRTYKKIYNTLKQEIK